MDRVKMIYAVLVVAGVVGGIWLWSWWHNSQKRQPTIKLPADIRKPVENPNLVGAISGFKESGKQGLSDELLKELNDAVYLVPIATGGMKTKEGGEEGKVVIEKGSIMRVLLSTDDEGYFYVLLCTDWDAIAKTCDGPVDTLVMPAKQAWDFILGKELFKGASINTPMGSLKIERKLIESLRKENKR